MSRFLAPELAQSAGQQDKGKIVKVRLSGRQAIVVFVAPGASSWQLPLLEEDGRWKVAAATPGVLAP
jgi:hypothetical protein